MSNTSKESIIDVLRQKVILKQQVYEKTKNVFNSLRGLLSQLSSELALKVKDFSGEMVIAYKDNGEFETEFIIGDETLLFVIHSNIFTFDSTHSVWKSSYVQEDKDRAYCGKIFIYNFLSDSFKYNRINDLGYLIGRIFINKDDHFFVEGMKQIGNLYNDFSTLEVTDKALYEIIEAAVLYSMEFDPFTPPFEQQGEIRVGEVIDASLQSRITTGKRLGFKFKTEGNIT